LINVNNDNLFTTADFRIGLNAATTASATVVNGDINFVITGGSAADSITGGNGADTISGGAGADVLYFNTGNAPTGELINGGADTDTLTVVTSTNFASATFGTTGTNTVLNQAAIENIVITSGTTGTFLGSQLTGQAININATAIGAANLVVTMADATTLSLVTATFGVSGGANAFDSGTDTVTINAGVTSTITGTTLADTIVCSTGVDTILYTVATTGTAASNGAGTDTYTSFSTTDIIDFTAAATTVVFAASSGADINLTATAIGTTNYLQADNATIANATGVAAATNVVIEMSSAVGTIAALTTAAFRAQFGAGGTTPITFGANDDFGGIVIAYDGTGVSANAAMFYVNTATVAGGVATISAGDVVQLIGIFSAVGSNALVFGNFA
jgi:hypothetical protein